MLYLQSWFLSVRHLEFTRAYGYVTSDHQSLGSCCRQKRRFSHHIVTLQCASKKYSEVHAAQLFSLLDKSNVLTFRVVTVIVSSTSCEYIKSG